ncbi:hypothetical protein Tco_1044594 [Tanacetum coccineum]|uniref:Uncharacterized protein n=1 Tax=Tanacetum coccineum TaxID=301880 RepID=A0ABQ5GRI8_9ASTR
MPSAATAVIVSAVCQANDHGFGGIRVPNQKRNTGTKEMEVFLFRFELMIDDDDDDNPFGFAVAWTKEENSYYNLQCRFTTTLLYTEAITNPVSGISIYLPANFTVVIHQASSLYAFEKKTISKINFSGAMVKPGRKIDFSEIKGINSRMPCQKYCRGVDHDAIWCCCRGSAKAMSICEDRKTDCERKCVEAKAECCFDGY